MTTNPTWYDILGVSRDASPEAIKAAWRAATDKFEPGSGTSHFRLFNEAADVLLDPERRTAYDAGLAGETDHAVKPVETPAPEVKPVGAPAPEVEPVETPTQDAEPTPDAEPAPTLDAEPGPAPAPPEAPAEPAAQGTGILGLLGRLNDVVIAIVAALAVASLVVAGFLAVRIHDRVQVADAGPDATSAAERALTAALSYDYQHMDADRDRAVQFLTPSYKKQYLKTFALLTAGPNGTPGGAVTTKTVVTADVLDTGIVDADANRVRVIAFVNQSAVKGDGQPTIFQNRLVATMVHRGDDWLIDDIKTY